MIQMLEPGVQEIQQEEATMKPILVILLPQADAA